MHSEFRPATTETVAVSDSSIVVLPLEKVIAMLEQALYQSVAAAELGLHLLSGP